ncbi:LytTR family transcriptional regulator DNA-binding domain-containing protein [Marinilongibacter aquaticus]|uniref:LytR/AlgR family response regulator transcription factor n=1 Tax=Marinilongibacter aquaticus TaxID=2975157 RepID=UPI0021BD8DE9|nr:LytTR family DNA-binding domain-containing protein [Marinilongibacter aquaticus]UBM58799.1 LytTR family transcriptional regulator DNA-binding domain-containing protein [Marinilongibacter aquaticus]
MEKLLLPNNVEMDCRRIILLESNSNYTTIFSTAKPPLVTVARSLCHVASQLDASRFLRVNRSTVVNVSKIRSFRLSQLHVLITMTSGHKIKSSRRRTATVLKGLKENQTLQST